MKKHKKIILGLLIILFIILNITSSHKTLAATITYTDPETGDTVVETTNEDGSTTTSYYGEDYGIVYTDEEIENANPEWKIKEGNSKTFASNDGHTLSKGDDFSWLVLKEHGDMLCNQRGVRLYYEQASCKYGTYYEGQILDKRPKAGTSTSIVDSVSQSLPADPYQAYVIAFATHESGGTEMTPAQLAWWGDTGNDLGKAAKEFADFIKAAGWSGKKYSGSKEQRTDRHGNVIPTGYFKFDYNPIWVTDEKDLDENDVHEIVNFEMLKNPTVKFDEVTKDGNDFVVGDFAIKYVYSELFSHITNIYIETNDSEHPILKLDKHDGSGGDFEIEVDKKKYLDKNGYPLSCVPFRFKIKNKYEATKITNIHIDFIYANGKGNYRILQSVAQDVWFSEVTTEDGTVKYEVHIPPRRTQEGAVDFHAEIKTFPAKLDRDTMKESQIEVQKIVTEGDETELDIDKFYEFKITVEGANEKDPEIIRVKAGSKAVSRVYTWEGDTAPTYTVEELNVSAGSSQIENGRGNFEDGNIAKGHLKDGTTVTIKVNNKIQAKKGKLSIEKRIIDSVGDPANVPIGEGATFVFNIIVKGKFRYFDQNAWRRV